MARDICLAFGLRMREKRTSLGISQEELAFKTGLHRTYISLVERGQRNISLVNIKKISDGLNVRMRDLMPD